MSTVGEWRKEQLLKTPQGSEDIYNANEPSVEWVLFSCPETCMHVISGGMEKGTVTKNSSGF
jgi:hypothetical protein